MILTDLPNDILIMLPSYLYNIEDFMNASSSCRALRHKLAATHPNQILRLAAASSRVFFRPDPYFLIAVTASQVGQWGLKSASNTESLRAAFRKGVDGLFNLCVSVAGITMDDIRRLHASRFESINPAADFIDRMAGKQWYATPDFWDGGVSEAATVDCEPTRTLFHFVIYGELFGSTMDAYLQPELNLPRYSLETRLDYIIYCVTDCILKQGCPGIPPPDNAEGPYAGEGCVTQDGRALHHVVRCGRWIREWQRIEREIAPDFEEDEEAREEHWGYSPGKWGWRQEMWHSAVQVQGLKGLEMLVVPDGVEKWRTRLQEIRTQIEQLCEDSNPRQSIHTFGDYRNPAYDVPMLSKEIQVCIAGYWQRS